VTAVDDGRWVILAGRVFDAGCEWREARQGCLSAGAVTADQYTRLANAEAALVDAVRTMQRLLEAR